MTSPAAPALAPAAPPQLLHTTTLPWGLRVRDALSAYLPLLLMALLAMATWWLVQNTPHPDDAPAEKVVRHDPDYTMQRFTLQRFGTDGGLLVQVEGEQLRHYPDTDTLEIDTVRIQSFTPDGGVTNATARRALANGDASEVQLLGGAQVQRSGGKTVEKIVFEGEFLHAFLRDEKLRSHLPVLVRQGTSELRAGGLEYDNLAQVAQLKGPVRARFIRRLAAAERMAGAPLVYITGASSGIGQALAARYHAAGWRLGLVARRVDEVNAWARTQRLPEASYIVYGADVRDVAAITGAGRACIERQGVPDVVIANAGISIGIDTSVLADLEVMRSIYETNNVGLAATFQPFLQAMWARRSGTLVGMASVAGIRGLPGHGAYSSSKAAVATYCESLRGECRPFGVKVVAIAPGYVDTPLTRRNPYSMPFMLSPEVFADRAFRAISAGVRYRVIPWQMGVAGTLLRFMPGALYDLLLAGRARKPRQGE